MLVFGYADSSDTGFEAVYSDVSELWGYMYALSWKLLIIGLLLEYLQHYLKDYTWRN